MNGDRDHLKMMKTPTNWPRWPALPVKRTDEGGFGVCGVMFAVAGPERNYVFLANLTSLRGPTIRAAMDMANEVIVYDSLEAVVLDGWVVD